MGDLNKFVNAMKWAATSDNVGYSQSDRDSLTKSKFFTNTKTNTDCSKLVIEALKYAGFDTGDASYTGDMAEELIPRGWKKVKPNGAPQKGDILLDEVHHVAVAIGSGQVAEASWDEHQGIAGGKRGDQTGEEVVVRDYYDPSYKWDMYLRWGGSSSGTSAATKTSAASKTSTTAKALPKPQYRAFQNGKWTDWGSDYKVIGAAGVPFYDFEAKGLGDKGWFQLTLSNGSELAKGKRNDAHRLKVIGITLYYDTPKGHDLHEVVYRARTVKGAWLKEEHDDDDGGAGNDRDAIAQFRAKGTPC